MTGLEYRVWTESSDLVYEGDSKEQANREMFEAIYAHISDTDCEGCGVLTPQRHHGFHIQICRDGMDVTGDPTL